MRGNPRPLVDALERRLADGHALTEYRRRNPKRVAALHALGAALDELGGTELDTRLRAAIAEYLASSLGGETDG